MNTTDKELLVSMIDGASVCVELFKAETPAQIKWKRDWLLKHRKIMLELAKSK